MDYNNEFEENSFPKRTDERYKRIENFKPYELTHCIVFEMAGRNEEIRKLIHDIAAIELVQNEVRKLVTPSIDSLFKDQKEEKKDEIPKSTLEKYQEYELIYKDMIRLLKEKYYIHYNQHAVNIPEIENPFKEKDFRGMSLEEIEEEFSYAFHAPMMTHISGAVGKYLHGEEYPLYKSDHNIYEGFVTARGIDPRCKTFNISNISTHFQRKIYDTNQINVALNMSLPEEELVEYIKHIKRTLPKTGDKSLKSPNYLLGKPVEEAKKTKHYPKIPTPKKLADMFFVYDYVTKRYNDYKTNDQDSIKNEIFDDLESYIPRSYYLEKQNKDNLDSENDQDMIFEDLVSPLYREKIKQLQRNFNKKNIHTKINDICDILKDDLDSNEISVIEKRYSKKINNPKENKIFEDLETILYNKQKKNIESKFIHISNNEIKEIFTDIETLIKKYKISSSTASNYYYALKPYIEEFRYPEFLTGESIIEENENKKEEE